MCGRCALAGTANARTLQRPQSLRVCRLGKHQKREMQRLRRVGVVGKARGRRHSMSLVFGLTSAARSKAGGCGGAPALKSTKARNVRELACCSPSSKMQDRRMCSYINTSEHAKRRSISMFQESGQARTAIKSDEGPCLGLALGQCFWLKCQRNMVG